VRTPPRDYSALSFPSFLSLIRLFFGSLYLFIEKEEKRREATFLFKFKTLNQKAKTLFIGFLDWNQMSREL
jgi:hypothetical protein